MDYYIRRFGFGSRTGIELPVTSWAAAACVSLAAIFIGSIAICQEIGVTPLQRAAAFAHWLTTVCALRRISRAGDSHPRRDNCLSGKPVNSVA